MIMVLLSIASVLSVAAIATVYQSWRKEALAWFYSGVVVFIVSCTAWSFSQGWEFGIVYALCAPALLVWPFIARNQVLLTDPRHIPQPRPVDVSFKQAGQHLWHGVVVLVGLLVTSLLVSVAISLRLPFADAGQLAVVIVLFPLLWGGLVYHYLATSSKGKALITYTVLSVVSFLLLIYLPGLK